MAHVEPRTFIVSSPCDRDPVACPARSPEEAVAIFLERACADAMEMDLTVEDADSGHALRFHVDLRVGSIVATS